MDVRFGPRFTRSVRIYLPLRHEEHRQTLQDDGTTKHSGLPSPLEVRLVAGALGEGRGVFGRLNALNSEQSTNQNSF